MRLALICAVLIIIGSIINSLRGGAGFPLPQALPGCGGPGRPLLFEAGAVALVGLGWWGLVRLFGPKQEDDE